MAWAERLQVLVGQVELQAELQAPVGQVELQAEWLQALMGQAGGVQMGAARRRHR
jgi:hypothetical protein